MTSVGFARGGRIWIISIRPLNSLPIPAKPGRLSFPWSWRSLWHAAQELYVYHNKRQEALDTCRQSLAEFSSARKAVLDTSENGSELQKLIRGALGVNDIIDAFADAATSAENTVDTEGCKADATITQLNLVSKTLDSATDSLNGSLKTIEKEPAVAKRRRYLRWHVEFNAIQ